MEKKQPRKTQLNGANGFGKRYQTPLQYGENLSTKSATLQNGGATELIKFQKAITDIQSLQLKVGEQLALILFEQTRLAEQMKNAIRNLEEYMNAM